MYQPQGGGKATLFVRKVALDGQAGAVEGA